LCDIASSFWQIVIFNGLIAAFIGASESSFLHAETFLVSFAPPSRHYHLVSSDSQDFRNTTLIF